MLVCHDVVSKLSCCQRKERKRLSQRRSIAFLVILETWCLSHVVKPLQNYLIRLSFRASPITLKSIASWLCVTCVPEFCSSNHSIDNDDDDYYDEPSSPQSCHFAQSALFPCRLKNVPELSAAAAAAAASHDGRSNGFFQQQQLVLNSACHLVGLRGLYGYGNDCTSSDANTQVKNNGFASLMKTGDRC